MLVLVFIAVFCLTLWGVDALLWRGQEGVTAEMPSVGPIGDAMDDGVRQVVLGFIQATEDNEAVEIIEVGGYGTDWDGDTESGFFSTFDAAIRWRRADGTTHHQEYVGESMAALWDWVIKGKRPEVTMQSEPDKAVNDLAELGDFAQRMAGFPAFAFDNPKDMPPCSHGCGQTSTRQPWVDAPLQCPWCKGPMCWDCSKDNLHNPWRGQQEGGSENDG